MLNEVRNRLPSGWKLIIRVSACGGISSVEMPRSAPVSTLIAPTSHRLSLPRFRP